MALFGLMPLPLGMAQGWARVLWAWANPSWVRGKSCAANSDGKSIRLLVLIVLSQAERHFDLISPSGLGQVIACLKAQCSSICNIKISQLEAKEKIERDILEQVAKILKVTPEAIQQFDADNALNIISNTFTSHDSSTLNAINHNCTFNPFDKLVEVYEENKKLYERLIQVEKEKVVYLERFVEKLD